MDEKALPPPNFKHLKSLTDDTGILQHAKYHIPNRDHGYCVDDNARALLVVTLARKIWPDHHYFDSLASTYLSFLLHAYNKKHGRFRNFMSYDQRWLETVGSEDSHGRAVWCLGVRAGDKSEGGKKSLASDLFGASVDILKEFSSPRALSFAILGLDGYLTSKHNAVPCMDSFESAAVILKRRHKANATENWPWLEDKLTYDNARISHALILAGHRLNDNEMMSFGLRSLEWLMEIQTANKTKIFSPIGNGGWFPRGGTMALFDQQPLEATSMIDACFCAFELTQDPKWHSYSTTCLGWFLGDNCLQISVYDPVSGGCKDGVSVNEINENQGAESTLCWLLALLAFYQRMTKKPRTLNPIGY